MNPHARPFTGEEDARLTAFAAAGKRLVEIRGEFPGRCEAVLRYRAQRLGLAFMPSVTRSNSWTAAELEILAREAPKAASLADLLPLFPGRKASAIEHKAMKLGLWIRGRRERRHYQAAGEAKRNARPRPCISCGGTFFSQGTHNRMCQGCKQRAEFLSSAIAI